MNCVGPAGESPPIDMDKSRLLSVTSQRILPTAEILERDPITMSMGVLASLSVILWSKKFNSDRAILIVGHLFLLPFHAPIKI